ncbi:uncharacterized protein AMSG_02588 [Thecamonas trahens ATCC 50062]|uniref:Uncharacterized protein n=1 Tax=Thecamonas trahens ATCC 50062 TaxID=461836 RepID=A0A0L0D8G1_THETB|nr:hypothetical protein AMSG_02588 [Thecamonas trahens ATCC 50062]KNC47563.1 hypothetical protein AMSG_02588 [Thecamonas trahens ATCC 50062]|eukprot:XP_013759495.1 hypothetical protein AMSG_02588 [Thecamonas trahens ATCC 50062]
MHTRKMMLKTAVGVVLLAMVMGAMARSSIYSNNRPWTAYAYDQVSNNMVIAFSPMQTQYGLSFGLETRMCDGPDNCGDSQTTYEVAKCIRDGTAQAVVEDISVYVPSTHNVFNGQYMLYTEYNPNLSGDASTPAANNLRFEYCPALGCAHSVVNNYPRTILENAYWPAMTFVQAALGKKVPAIGYVTIPKAIGSLPSVDHVGELTVTVCSKVDCDAQTDATKTVIDSCRGADDAGSPMCAGVSMTTVDQKALILYYGPSLNQGSDGIWLKTAYCGDLNCSPKTNVITDHYQVLEEVKPFAGDSIIMTRNGGFPAFVHVKSDGELYLTRCSVYDCQTTTEEPVSSGLFSQSQAEPHMAMSHNDNPVIIWIREVKVQGTTKRDIMIVYCDDEACTTRSSPEAITDCAGNTCSPSHPRITAVADDFMVISYWDTVHSKDFMVMCTNTTCTPEEIANPIEVDTTWGDGECTGLFPAPSSSPKKKSNAGAVAAGVIISLIALAGVAVFAYWFAVVRQGGRWPWEGIAQPKGLDSYAEL